MKEFDVRRSDPRRAVRDDRDGSSAARSKDDDRVLEYLASRGEELPAVLADAMSASRGKYREMMGALGQHLGALGLRRLDEQIELLAASPDRDIAAELRRRRARPEGLHTGLRHRAERSLGMGLGHVEVFHGPEAAREARRHGAAAMTIGSTIVLGDGMQNAPSAVMAEEVAHVAQQRHAVGSAPQVTAPTAVPEGAARRAAPSILAGRPAGVGSVGQRAIMRVERDTVSAEERNPRDLTPQVGSMESRSDEELQAIVNDERGRPRYHKRGYLYEPQNPGAVTLDQWLIAFEEVQKRGTGPRGSNKPKPQGTSDVHRAQGETYAPDEAPRAAPVQRKAMGAVAPGVRVQRVAQSGFAGGGRPLPYLQQLQRSFGRHDLGAVRAHVGSSAVVAAQRLGARAYAMGEDVAFGVAPDLHTVAHEAAHVVQQRGGVQVRGGLGQVGDVYERHAEQVADAVVRGRSAQAVLDRAPGGSGRGVQLETDETLSNIVEVNEGEGVCAVLGDDAEHLMDVFMADAQRLLDAWTDIREGPDLRFDARPLEERFKRFQSDWMSLPSNNAGPGGSPIAIANNPAALDELRRRMSSGTIPQYVQEIRVFNRLSLFRYADLLRLQDKPVRHRYQLLTTFAISGGAGEVLVGEVALASYKIVYSNDLDMHWSQSTECIRGGGGLGVGTSPISINVESSLGSGDLNAGSADVTEYFGPDFFDAAVVGYIGAEAILGSGASISAMTFSDGERTLTFDTSGLIARAGTDDVGALSATGGVGVCAHPTTSAGVEMGEVAPIEAAPREGEWTPVVEAALFFPTGSADLDAEDQETIAQVVRAILEHERSSPGDIFQLQIVGSASNRWRGQGSGLEKNTSLSVERASASRTALLTELAGVRTEFTEGVMSQSTMEQLHRRSRSADPDDNGQIDRSVYISVRYNSCGVGGNVTD